MTAPVMKVDRVTLYESPYRAIREEWSDDGRNVEISGNEVSPDLTLAEITARREDILALPGKFVSVVFEDKVENNGYYIVQGAEATLTNWKREAAVGCVWTIQLMRVGSDVEIDIESRLSGAQTRQTDHVLVGTRWQAPPIGHYAFWDGATSPSVLSRTGADGVILVYLALATNLNTRYGCSVGNYLRGRSRFIDSTGHERIGVDFSTSAIGWSLQNDLLKIIPAVGTGVIDVQAWDGGSFRSKVWDFRVDGVSLGVPQFVSVIRNDPFAVTVRMLYPNLSLPGRVTVDLLLRRGSRFVEVYMQRNAAATLLIRRLTAEAGTSATGWVGATANDLDGNRYIIGSAKVFTSDLANGGLSVAAATRLDAFIGAIVDGGTAVVGDRGIDLMQQYLGAPSEMMMGVRR